MTEWISVKNETPKKTSRYLTFHDNLICIKLFHYEERNFHDEYGHRCSNNITHWAELPEPPHD